MLNVIALMGRLVADPELRHTPNGIATCTFRIAVDRNFVRAGEERKADFIDIVAWRQSAEFVCKYFHKGNMIAVKIKTATSAQLMKWWQITSTLPRAKPPAAGTPVGMAPPRPLRPRPAPCPSSP